MPPTFKKIEACKYQYASTAYVIEKMADGYWVASLPGAYGYLWSSRYHPTRKAAAQAISMERRRVSKALTSALSGVLS